MQSSSDVLPLLCFVKLLLAAGGGSVPADSAALHLHSDQEALLDLRHRRLGHVVYLDVFMSIRLYWSLFCLSNRWADFVGISSVTIVIWALLKKQLDDEG